MLDLEVLHQPTVVFRSKMCLVSGSLGETDSHRQSTFYLREEQRTAHRRGGALVLRGWAGDRCMKFEEADPATLYDIEMRMVGPGANLSCV